MPSSWALGAVAIDLGGAHHHVAAPRPERVEDRPVRHPALDDGLRTFVAAHRQDVGDQGRHAVGHQQIGLEARPGEPRADLGQRADGAHQDLAVAAKGLGDRHGAHFGTGEFAHRARTASW
jgi:hypothetical protein